MHTDTATRAGFLPPASVREESPTYFYDSRDAGQGCELVGRSFAGG